MSFTGDAAGGLSRMPVSCRPVTGLLGLIALLAALGCAAPRVDPVAAMHPDGPVLTHAEPPAATADAAFFEDTRDIDPLRVTFPDWTLPSGHKNHVAVRAGQFVSNAIRARRYAPPVSAWFAEKVFLAAALAADTGGRFGGVPGLAPLAPEPGADSAAAYLAAFTAAAAHYGETEEASFAAEAARFREAWLARLRARPGADAGAIALGLRRGERAAAAVIDVFPRLEPGRVGGITPAEFRAAIAPVDPPPPYGPRQAWQVTPAPGHLERRPFNDYKPVAPGIGLVPPLPRLGRAEARVPPFPEYGSDRWWAALEAVAKYGAVDSPCRTGGQALTGWFFEASASGPPAEAANAVTSVIAYRDLPPAEAARAQFLVWSSMATAGILTWREKYRHDILRPVTAMNRALREVAEVPEGWRWDSLGPTPPFPAYPSGHAAFTPAGYLTLAMILAEHVEDPMGLRVVAASADPWAWGALMNPEGSSRALAFDSLGDLISAANESRGYLGIHWEADGVWGRYLGSLAAVRTHQQLLTSPRNPTRPELAFPKAPPGALDDPDYDPKADWPGVTRPWTRQFPAGLARATGREPAEIIAFPALEGVDLPWANTCAADPE